MTVVKKPKKSHKARYIFQFTLSVVALLALTVAARYSTRGSQVDVPPSPGLSAQQVEQSQQSVGLLPTQDLNIPLESASIFLAYARVENMQARVYSSYLPSPTDKEAYMSWVIHDNGKYEKVCQLISQPDGAYVCEADLSVEDGEIGDLKFMVTAQPTDLSLPAGQILVSENS